MQSTPDGVALIGVGGTRIGTIVGAILGAWLTHRYAVTLADSNAKRFAGMKLREAFAPEIAKFSDPKRLNMITSAGILESAFEKHQLAVDEFRFYLTGIEAEAFHKAWHDYYCAPDGEIDFSGYIDEPKDALMRMEAIIAFTRQNPSKTLISSLIDIVRSLRIFPA